MDDILKVQREVMAEAPSNVAQLAKPIPATQIVNTNRAEITESDIATQVKNLVAEGLSENVDLSRLRELNRLVAALLSTQLGGPSSTPVVSAESADLMRRFLRQTALDSYREEYKEFADVWKSLESKAQGTVTIAGIFIAAAFTFAKDLATTRLDFYGNVFLGAAILLLIPTVICSVLVLWKRTVKSIPSGETVEQCADALVQTTDDDLADHTRRFLDQQSALWKETVASTKEAIARKAELLHAAQVLLLLAIGAAAVVTLKLINV
jgi:hypothetical protein